MNTSCRHYFQARVEHEQFPVVVKQLIELLQSQPFFKLLRMFTGLELAEVSLDESRDDNEKKEKKDHESSVSAINYTLMLL